VYHVELRQFPHNFCRFNLTERELREMILDAWAQGDWIELGERKWNPQQANLRVLEGPRLPVEQLSMGRGWRNAVRQGQDVTERMILAARQAPRLEQGVEPSPESGIRAESTAPSDSEQTRSRRPDAERLAAELLTLLGEDPIPLMRAWQLALEQHADRTPSECLALAEDLVRR
jgi:hypothetical protein